MDEDGMFRVKAVKSYTNTFKSRKKTKSTSQETIEDYTPLTTKNAVKFLLEGSLKYKVCRYCLNIASPLCELDEIFEVARKGAVYKVTLRVMIASVHPFKVAEDPNFPDKICNRCVESAITSYMFSQQCERAERALRNCFDDIHTKFEKLDPLDRPKKRGRQKLNPNPNVLHAEHNEVIDYADPIIHLINIDSSSLQDYKEISPLECPKCWQVLPDLDSLLNHQSLHPKSMWYSCRLCGQSFINYRPYKKHIKDVHKDGQISNIQSRVNKSFRCSECGAMSSSFGVHLQHIEKHKFKTTFEHLIDRSMHRLCAVCLEQKSCMIHMNESIHLNSGYPGINNEQAIYQIVSSTFPEPKSYKYQELLIPKRANIMTITKRADTWQIKNLALKNHIKNMFKFCHPTILSTLNTELEPLYIFIFSNPYQLADLLLGKAAIPSNLPQPDSKDLKNKLNFDDGTLKETDKKYEDPQENSNTYIVAEICEAKVEENLAKFCKVCWIFKKPLCDQCINNRPPLMENNDILNEDKIVTDKENCKYCWLFETVGQCDYCKKNLKDSQKNKYFMSIDPNMNDVLNVGQNDVKNVDKTITELDSEIDTDYTYKFKEVIESTRKRKLSSNLTNAQKLKWQCRVCLTNNDKNRQTCFCCDFDYNVMDNNVKFKFGENKNLFKYNIPNNTCEIQAINNVLNTVQENHSNLITNETPTNLEKYNLDSVTANIVPMDVEIINFSDSQSNSNNIGNNNFHHVVQESMEVTYEDMIKPQDSRIISPTNLSYISDNIIALPNANTVTPTVNNLQLTPQNMPFQFTIGASTTTTPKQRKERDFRRRIMGRK